MSIIKSIERAYSLLEERNWDTIYWCIDLHGTCLKSNYDNCDYEFINEDAKKTLQLISSLKESVIILWSSCYNDIKPDIFQFFNENNIRVWYFNENIEINNTKTGCFNEKFYFSIGLDDKFGFDPDTDWELIYNYLKNKNNGN